MARIDRGHSRFAAWLGVTFLLVFTLYSRQLTVLTSGLNTLLSSTLGTVFPAYPFLALLLLLTGLRWNEFHRVLLAEKGLTSRPRVRLAGMALVLLPAALWALLYGAGSPSTYVAMEISAASFVLVAYGVLLVINPTMWRVMLPYASLYAVGLVSPLLVLDALGGPLASLSSYMAAGMTRLIGLQVAWQGVSFGFVSAAGAPISSVVTPVCSAAYSISIYLALLGLMYLDMGVGAATTLKFAVAGVAIIPLLNSLRIAVMIWFGYMDGAGTFWAIHDWLGYGIFLAFYLVVLVAYARARDTTPRPARSVIHPVAPMGPSPVQ
jgi:exosortase/archaeosortase family protein